MLVKTFALLLPLLQLRTQRVHVENAHIHHQCWLSSVQHLIGTTRAWRCVFRQHANVIGTVLYTRSLWRGRLHHRLQSALPPHKGHLLVRPELEKHADTFCRIATTLHNGRGWGTDCTQTARTVGNARRRAVVDCRRGAAVRPLGVQSIRPVSGNVQDGLQLGTHPIQRATTTRTMPGTVLVRKTVHRKAQCTAVGLQRPCIS